MIILMSKMFNTKYQADDYLIKSVVDINVYLNCIINVGIIKI